MHDRSEAVFGFGAVGSNDGGISLEVVTSGIRELEEGDGCEENVGCLCGEV